VSWRELDEKTRWIVLGVYVYSALQILGWYVWLYSNQSEAWLPAFNVAFIVLFMPLNILAIAICRLVWGTFDLFHARYVFSPMLDGAAASLLAATAIAAGVVLARRNGRPAVAARRKGGRR
jgi:hypothetical protein